MSEQQAGYMIKIDPTEAELNLIARLRQLRGMVIVDSDSMTLYPTSHAEYLTGRRPYLVQTSTPVLTGT